MVTVYIAVVIVGGILGALWLTVLYALSIPWCVVVLAKRAGDRIAQRFRKAQP